MALNDRRQIWACVAALIAVAIVSRLPQLLGRNLLLDGDECLLGLMAKHVGQGREIPIFLYGQHYGLSSFEAAAGALAFAVFGFGPVTLALAMLALWIAGVLFLFAAQSTLLGTRRSFWITLILVLTPAWANASINARGGYITSFTATGALFWLLLRHRERETAARWLLAGLLTGVIYLAQPLWLPGLLPIVIVVLLGRRRLSWGLSWLAATAAVIVLVKAAPVTNVETWFGPPLGNADPIGSIPDLARQIYVTFTGSYYLASPRDPGPITNALALLWCGGLAAAAAVQLYRLFTRRYYLPSHVLFVSLCSTIGAVWILLSARDARYLLPLSPLLVLLAGVELTDLVDRKLAPKRTAYALTVAVLLLGALSMREFSRFNYLWVNPPQSLSETERMRRLVAYLQTNGVRHVYSMNGLLDAQLMFYSDERILARWKAPRGRYPAYGIEVDRALTMGKTVAVVGYTNASGAPGCWDVPICTGGIERLVQAPDAVVTVADKYFVYVGANRELLQKLGFRFWE